MVLRRKMYRGANDCTRNRIHRPACGSCVKWFLSVHFPRFSFPTKKTEKIMPIAKTFPTTFITPNDKPNISINNGKFVQCINCDCTTFEPSQFWFNAQYDKSENKSYDSTLSVSMNCSNCGQSVMVHYDSDNEMNKPIDFLDMG